MKKLRALVLYSGIGGMHCGLLHARELRRLRLAGVAPFAPSPHTGSDSLDDIWKSSSPEGVGALGDSRNNGGGHTNKGGKRKHKGNRKRNDTGGRGADGGGEGRRTRNDRKSTGTGGGAESRLEKERIKVEEMRRRRRTQEIAEKEKESRRSSSCTGECKCQGGDSEHRGEPREDDEDSGLSRGRRRRAESTEEEDYDEKEETSSSCREENGFSSQEKRVQNNQGDSRKKLEEEKEIGKDDIVSERGAQSHRREETAVSSMKKLNRLHNDSLQSAGESSMPLQEEERESLNSRERKEDESLLRALRHVSLDGDGYCIHPVIASRIRLTCSLSSHSSAPCPPGACDLHTSIRSSSSHATPLPCSSDPSPSAVSCNQSRSLAPSSPCSCSASHENRASRSTTDYDTSRAPSSSSSLPLPSFSPPSCLPSASPHQTEYLSPRSSSLSPLFVSFPPSLATSRSPSKEASPERQSSPTSPSTPPLSTMIQSPGEALSGQEEEGGRREDQEKQKEEAFSLPMSRQQVKGDLSDSKPEVCSSPGRHVTASDILEDLRTGDTQDARRSSCSSTSATNRGFDEMDDPLLCSSFSSNDSSFLSSLPRLPSVPFEVVGAIDVNPTAMEVYRKNLTPPCWSSSVRSSSSSVSTSPCSSSRECYLSTKSIDSYSPSFYSSFNADIWLISPPCQPYTRSGLQKGNLDRRTTSFLYLLDILCNLSHEERPKYILIENVVKFEVSDTFECLLHTLKCVCNYELTVFHLNPLHFGIPNCRTRCFVSAKKLDSTYPLSSYSLLGIPLRQSPSRLLCNRFFLFFPFCSSSSARFSSSTEDTHEQKRKKSGGSRLSLHYFPSILSTGEKEKKGRSSSDRKESRLSWLKKALTSFSKDREDKKSTAREEGQTQKPRETRMSSFRKEGEEKIHTTEGDERKRSTKQCVDDIPGVCTGEGGRRPADLSGGEDAGGPSRTSNKSGHLENTSLSDASADIHPLCCSKKGDDEEKEESTKPTGRRAKQHEAHNATSPAPGTGSLSGDKNRREKDQVHGRGDEKRLARSCLDCESCEACIRRRKRESEGKEHRRILTYIPGAYLSPAFYCCPILPLKSFLDPELPPRNRHFLNSREGNEGDKGETNGWMERELLIRKCEETGNTMILRMNPPSPSSPIPASSSEKNPSSAVLSNRFSVERDRHNTPPGMTYGQDESNTDRSLSLDLQEGRKSTGSPLLLPFPRKTSTEIIATQTEALVLKQSQKDRIWFGVDLVRMNERRSNCFTKSYGRSGHAQYGSLLLLDEDLKIESRWKEFNQRGVEIGEGRKEEGKVKKTHVKQDPEESTDINENQQEDIGEQPSQVTKEEHQRMSGQGFSKKKKAKQKRHKKQGEGEDGEGAEGGGEKEGVGRRCRGGEAENQGEGCEESENSKEEASQKEATPPAEDLKKSKGGDKDKRNHNGVSDEDDKHNTNTDGVETNDNPGEVLTCKNEAVSSPASGTTTTFSTVPPFLHSAESSPYSHPHSSPPSAFTRVEESASDSVARVTEIPATSQAPPSHVSLVSTSTPVGPSRCSSAGGSKKGWELHDILPSTVSVRLFTPKEMLALHGFPSSFSFPNEDTPSHWAQHRRLVGNSLNVFLVGMLIDSLVDDGDWY